MTPSVKCLLCICHVICSICRCRFSSQVIRSSCCSSDLLQSLLDTLHKLLINNYFSLNTINQSLECSLLTPGTLAGGGGGDLVSQGYNFRTCRRYLTAAITGNKNIMIYVYFTTLCSRIVTSY